MTYPPPRYSGEHGETSASFRAASHPAELVTPNGQVHYLATAATTGGDYGLYRWEMTAAPSGPAPHFHRTMSEAFYVLSGTVRLSDGEREVDAHPGDHLHVPAGGVHGFRNVSGEPASMLILFAPGAPRERYFEELVEVAASGRELSAVEWADLYARHDQYMV